MIVAPLRDLWAPEIARLWAGYRTIPFPLEPIEVPAQRLELWWSLEELLAYVYTWSAVQRKLRQDGPDFFEHAGLRLETLWGDRRTPRRVEIPLHLRAGRCAKG